MRFNEIKVYLLGKSVPDRGAIETWVNDMLPEGHTHRLPPPEECTDAELVVACAAKRCYKSYEAGLNLNVQKVREDLTVFLDNVLSSGHGSVLEHATWTFAIENITRVFTAEMNRHRAGVAISEGSMRFILQDVLEDREGLAFWLPLMLRKVALEDVDKSYYAKLGLSAPEEGGGERLPFYPDWGEIEANKRVTREVFEEVISFIEDRYRKLALLWGLDREGLSFAYKKAVTSMLRRIIPMGVCTGGVWTMNARAMRWIIEQRTSLAAEEEIAHVFNLIAQLMVESEPRLFGDFVDDNGHWMPKYHKV